MVNFGRGDAENSENDSHASQREQESLSVSEVSGADSSLGPADSSGGPHKSFQSKFADRRRKRLEQIASGLAPGAQSLSDTSSTESPVLSAQSPIPPQTRPQAPLPRAPIPQEKVFQPILPQSESQNIQGVSSYNKSPGSASEPNALGTEFDFGLSARLSAQGSLREPNSTPNVDGPRQPQPNLPIPPQSGKPAIEAAPRAGFKPRKDINSYRSIDSKSWSGRQEGGLPPETASGADFKRLSEEDTAVSISSPDHSFPTEPQSPEEFKRALDAIGLKTNLTGQSSVARNNSILSTTSSQDLAARTTDSSSGQVDEPKQSLKSKALAALANAKKGTGLSPLQLAAKKKEEEQARAAQEEAEAQARLMRARQEEQPIPKNRWGQAPEAASSQSIWVDQLGISKKAEPIHGPSATLRGRLKRVMSSDIFNVKELYSLRGIAALFVFVAQAQLFVAHSKPAYPLSVIGAQIFFVMSGFVITRWLLVNERGSLKSTLSEFYARRVLRIFPTYYLVLGILLFTGHLPHADSFFCGLFNLKAFDGIKMPSQLLQYWTLCVELQFYGLFPCLLILTPPRFRMFTVVLLTAGSAIWVYLNSQTHSHAQDWLLLSISGQYIMWGCLAGYMDVKSNIALSVNASVCVLIGLAGEVALHAWFVFFGKVPTLAVADALWKSLSTFNACTLAIFIFGLWRTSNVILKGLFANEALVYFGKISYGFYLLLPLCFFMQPSIIAVMPLLAKVPPVLTSFIITFIAAVLTFHYFQLPINNMRERLPIAR